MFESEPMLIEKYSKHQYGSPIITGLMEALTHHYCNEDVILVWLSRMEQAGQVTEADTLWIKTIISLRTGNWSRVVELCDALLEKNAQNEITAPKKTIEDARKKAIEEIKRLNIQSEPAENAKSR